MIIRNLTGIGDFRVMGERLKKEKRAKGGKKK
jgi:hypothetical protein